MAAHVTSQPRYWNIFRQAPSGKTQKRILNRATTCPLCGKPLGTDRALRKAYTGFSDFEMIAAHPGCADKHMQELTERLQGGIGSMLRRLA